MICRHCLDIMVASPQRGPAHPARQTVRSSDGFPECPFHPGGVSKPRSRPQAVERGSTRIRRQRGLPALEAGARRSRRPAEGLPGLEAGVAGAGGRQAVCRRWRPALPGLAAAKEVCQLRANARGAGAHLRNPLLTDFKGSSPSGLWAVWATRSVVQAAGGRPPTLPGQSLSPDAAPSTARIAGPPITDDPGQDPRATVGGQSGLRCRCACGPDRPGWFPGRPAASPG